MAETIAIQVELFGTARIACGCRSVEVRLPASASISDITAAISEACPQLVGVAIHTNRNGLLESYILNLNGIAFVDESGVALQPGDTLLLFSSQAGGCE